MNKEGFLAAVNTLKLYRRAELVDEEGRQLINELYVDPLPEDHVLDTLLRPTTTFLIGRKGTGKSTIFQRAQEKLTTDAKCTWAYIDIKTLYESSASEPLGISSPEIQSALSPEAVRNLCVFKSFMLDLIREIKNQIKLRVNSSVWGQVREAFTGSASELFEKLDEFVEEIEKDSYLDVTGSLQASRQDEEKERKISKHGLDLAAKLAAIPSAEGKLFAEIVSEIESNSSQNYSQVFIRVFNIRRLITRLREILATLNLKHLYIFIDDFSELPQSDMEQVVDTVLAPFNNWSDEFIKLKVAVYPGRLYEGAIDLSKIDQVYLDIYRSYGRNDVSGMEEKAIDFTERLLKKRIDHFCQDSIDTYFETNSDEFWRTLFYSSFGNPRILGYILYYSYETTIIYGKRIGIRTIQDASRRYYEEKIAHYFKLSKFLHETFDERSSIYSLKELLEEIVKKAKELRTYKGSKLLRELEGRPPSSHFHVSTHYDSVLSTLELNFFLTKYYEMKDRDGQEVSVYALNYGLCQQQAIAFGRPRQTRAQRTYFIERIFDYSAIISSYIKVNQEIVCDQCGHSHGSEMLPAIQAFNMLCPECKSGTCKLVNLSRKYEQLIRDVAAENLLPDTELGILHALHDERKTMFAKQIASELDCSYQLVGKRGRNLSERDLVKRDENDRGRRIFSITEQAEKVYFVDVPGDSMNFEESDSETEAPEDPHEDDHG